MMSDQMYDEPCGIEGIVHIAMPHGFQPVAATIFGPVAVHRCPDIDGVYAAGTALWRVSHIATGHAITMPHHNHALVALAADRLATQPDLRAITGEVHVLRLEVERMMAACAALAAPLQLSTGHKSIVQIKHAGDAA